MLARHYCGLVLLVLCPLAMGTRTSTSTSLDVALPSTLRPSPDAFSESRRKVERIATDAAKEGLEDVALACLDLLGDMGSSPKSLERLRGKVEKALIKGKSEPKASKLASLTKSSGDAAAALVKAAQAADDSEALLRLALRLDSTCEGAHEALGHVRGSDGVFRSQEALALFNRRRVIADAAQRARELEFTIKAVEPREPVLAELCEGPVSAFQHKGLTIESYWPAPKLEGVFRDLLRATAFSNWLVRGKLEVSHRQGVILHVPVKLFPAFNRRMAELGRGDERFDSTATAAAFTYVELPGGGSEANTRYAVAASGERAGLCSVLLILYDTSLDGWSWNEWYKPDPVVPFWVVVGHTNYVSQSFLGIGVSRFGRVTDSQETSASGPSREYSMARAGLAGCRSWLRHLVREGRAPGLARCVQDGVEKIAGDKRLKATSAIEYLHEQESFEAFVANYAKRLELEKAPSQPELTPLSRLEAVLEQTSPEFDAEWERWLLGGSSAGSLRDLIQAAALTTDKTSAAIREDLNARRLAAGLKKIELDGELSRGAALHAAYLELNPAQKTAWPDAHEESFESDGFSSEGAWSGLHSVVAFNGHDTCLDDWIGTFYHRVPLTHPGLLRIGFAAAGDTSVLDCTSLSDPSGAYEGHYPFDGQKGVPLKFRPELPNPVPEREDQSTLGYPITYQIGPDWDSTGVELKLLLNGETVPCFYSTPGEPTNPRIAPAGCFCLIPKSPLEPNKQYEVVITGPGRVSGFGFKTGR